MSSKDQIDEIIDDFDKIVVLEGNDEDDFEFFVGGGGLSSPVSAEEVFLNGQFRPLLPFTDENAVNSDEETTSYDPPVRKVFVVSSTTENDDGVAEGPYCDWSSENSPETAPEMSRKSNSTGFSKLWKVRDLLVRSHSDGKDAFVFLTGKNEEKAPETTSLDEKKKKKKINISNLKVGGSKGVETTSLGVKKGKQSAYEVYYGKREKKVGKSYLPYRQELVGFFTNTNGMSRNVHPY